MFSIQLCPGTTLCLILYMLREVCLSLCTKSYRVTIQMKATEQFFSVVLFIMLYKVILTFQSVHEIL